MPRRSVSCSLILLAGVVAWNMPARAQLPSVPPGFVVTLVADTLRPTFGIAVAPASFGAHAGDVFLAAALNTILRVTPNGDTTAFATGVSHGPANLAFGPGGGFGTDLYVSCAQDPDLVGRYFYGAMWRIGPSGQVAYFATQTPPSPLAYEFGSGGVAFSTGGAFGEFLYTGFSGGEAGDGISRIASGDVQAQLFSQIGDGATSDGAPLSVQFGPGIGGFGSDLYFSYLHGVGGPGLDNGIYTLNSGGLRTAFSTAFHPVEIEFGPGGAFGTDLYVVEYDDTSAATGRILRLDSAGTPSVFVSRIRGNAFGLAFADSSALYFNAVGNGADPGRLFRVAPDQALAVPTASGDQTLKMRVEPNPFAGAVSIEWSLRQAGPNEVCVYSVDGRRIRQVLNSTLGPGIHRATWDGTDDAGHRAGPGVYVATILSGNRRSVCRIGLLR